MTERFKIVLGVINIIKKDNKILLLLRKNKFDSGLYSLPGGCLEKFEQAKKTAIREIKEETNLDVNENDVKIVSTLYRNIESWQSVELVCLIETFYGKEENKEADKSENLTWFNIDNLPSNMSGYALTAIENYKNNIIFSEINF